MSSAGSQNLLSGRNVAFLVGSGLAIGGAVYAGYCYFKQSNAENKDEGFEEITKIDDTEKRILVLGLDNSGKSSFLSGISRQDETIELKPTEGFNVICVQTDNVALNFWEIGGRRPVRKYWCNFTQDTDILVFVVDSADDRLPEAYDELHKLLGDERLRGVPIILLASKQDLPNAQKPSKVSYALGLDSMPHKEHVVHVMGTQFPPGGTAIGTKEVEQLILSLI